MNYFFTFSNMTAAQSAKALLAENEIIAVIRRTSGAMAESGCGYMIEVSAGNGRWASGIMRRGGTLYRKCYRKDGGGVFREVRL